MSLPYRKEIDGLRGIAVLSVLIYHADFGILNGGYLGVDIFFVISGYLITRIIINDIQYHKFDLLHFFERRVRRLFPALFVVISASAAFSYIILTPNELRDFSQSIVSSVLFSSNILFYIESDYFSVQSNLKPLLHTWSLAVEEQFYLLFPPILLITSRYPRKFVICLILILLAISLATAHYGSTQFKTASFYLLPSRAWELLAGSLIAFCDTKDKNRLSAFWSDFISIFGLFLISISFFYFDQFTHHPGVPTLVPIIGTSAVILCSQGTKITRSLLSNRILVGTGLISYSLYLWHFPIFALSRNYSAQFTTDINMFFLIFLSVLLSILSYQFVEKPFRRPDGIIKGRGNTFRIAGVSMLFLVSLGAIGHLGNGFAVRFPGSDSWRVFDATSFLSYGCKDELHDEIVSPCSFSLDGPRLEIIGFGDSHINQWAGAFKRLASEEPVNVSIFSKSACPASNIILMSERLGRRYYECETWREAAIEQIAEENPDVLIIQNSALGYIHGGVEPQEWKLGMQKTLSHFGSIDKIIWLQDNPRLAPFTRQCVERTILSGSNEDPCSSHREAAISDEIVELEKSVANLFDNVMYLDLNDYFCDKITCYSIISGKPIMVDSNHISEQAAKELITELYTHIRISE